MSCAWRQRRTRSSRCGRRLPLNAVRTALPLFAGGSATPRLRLFSQRTFAEHLLHAGSTPGPVAERRVGPASSLANNCRSFPLGGGGGGAKSPGPHSVLCEPFLTLVYIVTYLLQPPAPESSRSGWVEGPTCPPAAGEPRRPQATTRCPRGAAGGRCSEGRPAGLTDGQEVPSASKK